MNKIRILTKNRQVFYSINYPRNMLYFLSFFLSFPEPLYFNAFKKTTRSSQSNEKKINSTIKQYFFKSSKLYTLLP